MRALGPGSVSSFLKVILDVFRFIVWIAIAGTTLAIVAALLLSFRPDWLGRFVTPERMAIEGPWVGPTAAAVLLAADLYLGGAVIVVGRLRSIFQTLIAGDPFHPENAKRLRVIGFALAALELGRYAVATATHLLFHGLVKVDGSVSLTTWFAVLVIAVLAEVFREGARLRGEAELTI
jgi:hypothetical protein